MANSRGGSGYEPPPQQPGQRPQPPRRQQQDPYVVDAYLSSGQPHAYGNHSDDEYEKTGYRTGAHRTSGGPSNTGSGNHRRRAAPRRKRGSAAKIGVTGAIVGVLGIAAVAVTVVALRSGGGSSANGTATGSSQTSDGYPRVAAPATGTVLSVATPDPFDYGIGAIDAGITQKAISSSATAPTGDQQYAYGDYLFTNTGSQPALLDFTAVDLFVKKTKVPDASQSRCMPQPGTESDMCTLPNSAVITAIVDGSKAPITQDGQQFMPAGARYVVRVETSLAVDKSVTRSDLNMYVWQARFISNRKAVVVPLP